MFNRLTGGSDEEVEVHGAADFVGAQARGRGRGAWLRGTTLNCPATSTMCPAGLVSSTLPSVTPP